MSRIARFSMIGLMGVIAPLAFAGCVAPAAADGAGDEVAGDEVASDEVASAARAALASGELAGDTSKQIVVGPSSLTLEQRTVTCSSGWPGTRGCHFVFTSTTDIFAGTPTASIIGPNGELGHSMTQTGARTFTLTVAVREGDAFNPGTNSTTFSVAWVRN